MEYFIVCFVYEQASYLCIWMQSDDVDMFYSSDNCIKFFDKIDELYSYATVNNFDVDKQDIYEYNLDFIESYFCEYRKIIDSGQILNYWNIFSDVATTLNVEYLGNKDITYDIYEKIFYGNNLETINKTEEKYIPKFSFSEYSTLKKIMLEGRKIVINQIKKYIER